MLLFLNNNYCWAGSTTARFKSIVFYGDPAFDLPFYLIKVGVARSRPFVVGVFPSVFLLFSLVDFLQNGESPFFLQFFNVFRLSGPPLGLSGAPWPARAAPEKAECSMIFVHFAFLSHLGSFVALCC